MIVIERRKKIKELLIKNTSVKVSDLVDLLSVSEETIRRDLLQLEKEGVAIKNYGGAILSETLQRNESSILPVTQRHLQYSIEKELIGKAAAELVEDDQIVILDAGSTTFQVGRHLNQKGLTIITNALNIAEECSKEETASIYLLGGKLMRNSMSLVGPQAESELKKFSADYVFLGTAGISLRQGFTSSDLYEAEMKRAMVSAGQKIVVVADHSKLQKAGLTPYCDFEEIDIFVTSDRIDRETLKKIESKGIDVIVTTIPEFDSLGRRQE